MGMRSGVISVMLATAVAGCTDYLTIEVDGRTREYLVHAPGGSAPRDGRPVVFVYHGAFTTAADMEDYAQLDPVADDEGFIAVYPNGVNRLWYDGRIPDEVDDVAFTDALLDRIIEDYEVDETRVYATGISNGGFMTHRVACDLSERFVAIAPVAGTLSQELRDECEPTRPVPVMMVMGTKDNLVPYDGGKLGGRFAGDFGTMLSAVDSIEWWAAQADCELEPAVEKFDEVDDGTKIKTRTYGDCAEDAEMMLYTVEDGGHTWPGASKHLLLGKTSREIDASETMWTFFDRFRGPWDE